MNEEETKQNKKDQEIQHNIRISFVIVTLTLLHMFSGWSIYLNSTIYVLYVCVVVCNIFIGTVQTGRDRRDKYHKIIVEHGIEMPTYSICGFLLLTVLIICFFPEVTYLNTPNPIMSLWLMTIHTTIMYLCINLAWLFKYELEIYMKEKQQQIKNG